MSAFDLVVDVDPRNFPDGETLDTDNPLRRLCAAVGLDPDAYPTVVTGSGGLHLYMTKPTDVALLDTHPDYPGVEFKSRGRQVVAAGSVHPDTCVTYVWDPLGMGLLASGAPEAPSALVELARRPMVAASTGGGEYAAEQLAAMLDRLDPTDFRDQDRWLQLMMACHHATDGDGRQEFIDWSTGDPAYADDAGRIGARWDSLHRAEERGGPAVTFKTLHKFLTDAGAGEAIPRAAAADDFADVEEDNAELVRLIESEKKEDMRIGEESRRAGLSVRRIGLDDAKRACVSFYRRQMKLAGEEVPTSPTARARRADWQGVTERVSKREHTVGWMAEEAIRAGYSNAEALELVREMFPHARTSPASIAWYRSQMRARGAPGAQEAGR